MVPTRRTALSLLVLAACARDPEPADRGAAPDFQPPAPVLRRLSEAQYMNAIADVFGDDVVITTGLEPDESVDGLYSVGASVVTISSLGVEEYESAAFSIAEQAMDSAATRAALVPCSPEGTVDDACAEAAIRALGREVWRRPLTDAEAETLVTVAGTAAETLGDFYSGLEYAIAALLQSPHFLFRVELGEEDPDAPGTRRYTNWEMASRLSFFLWNTTPDEELLDAAEAGELTEDAGLEAQVARMLAHTRSREGLRNFVTEWLTLYDLDDMTKDPDTFVHYSADVGASAREQTLSDLEHLVFYENGDYRDIFTSQWTHVDRKLAAIYNVAAPSRDGFGEAWLPDSGGRRGLLGQVSVLAQFAHPTATSPTLRGLFVREVLLCQSLPPPPGDVATVLPEPSDDAPTLRDRLEQHREDPTCAACHDITDPIGLGLENFDGLGSWRETDNGVTIDASGELDGVTYNTAWDLAAALAEHERLGPCLAETMYRYAGGRVLGDADDAQIDWHAEGFVSEDHRVLFLLRDVALGPGFRRVGAVE